MKTKLFLLALIIGGFSISAQVFINDSFIYSKGTHIFVKQDIDITNNGAFYLRDEAQLIQEDDVDNEGEGFLSVFQEGTQNEFTYNFWSAPVGLASATAGNLGFDMDAQTYFPRLMPGFGANTFDPATTAANLSTNLVIDAQLAAVTVASNPTGLTDLQDDIAFTVSQPLTISGRWLFEYNNNGLGGGAYGNWLAINTGSNPTVSAGYGFSMKGVTQSASTDARNLVANAFTGFDGQRYDFRGRPNNGNIPVTVSTDDVALVGNPYPSALDLKQFLDDNSDLVFNSTTSAWEVVAGTSEMNAEILYWESVSTSHQLTDYIGGYGTYVPNGFDPGTNNGYDNNGTYVQAAYSRYNSDGTPSGGSVFGATSSISGVNRRFAPIGQGFMITRPESVGFTLGDTGNVVFNNGQRLFYKESDGNLSFFANAPGSSSSNTAGNGELPKIRFNVAVNDLYVRELVLQFDPTVTMNYDYSWEGRVDTNKQVNDVYMPVSNNNLIINSIPFSIDKVVPVTFDMASASTYEFSIKELENFDTPLIYLEDTATGMLYDLKSGTATLQLPSGIIDNRFQIVFQDPSTLSNGDIAIEDRFNVVQNNNAGQLTIFNPSQRDVANVSLYDLGGKLIFDQNENNNDSQYTYNTDQLSTGIYIVRISTVDSEQVAVKVSVSN